MDRNLIVLDNFLDDPDYVLDLAKNISSDLSIIEKEDFFFNNGFNFYK